MVSLASFWKPEACGQTVLPDMSNLLGQKLVENAKIEKFKWDILSNFQTMWHMAAKKAFDNGFLLSFILKERKMMHTGTLGLEE